MDIEKGERLWSKDLSSTAITEIVEFIAKTDVLGLLAVSDNEFLILNQKKVVAASSEEHTGDSAIPDLFAAFEAEERLTFYSLPDLSSVKDAHPELFLDDPAAALTQYLGEDQAERIADTPSREELLKKYKIRPPKEEEIDEIVSSVEKKEKAKLQDFKEFVDAVYGGT